MHPIGAVTNPRHSDELGGAGFDATNLFISDRAHLVMSWGAYPYVTSSSPIPGGASIGAGLPAVAIDRVLGVASVPSACR